MHNTYLSKISRNGTRDFDFSRIAINRKLFNSISRHLVKQSEPLRYIKYYRFTRDHHLKTHMRLHTGEKPYHCSHCDRQFVQVANLRRHLRVHTGERPYACELCAAKFSDSNQLKAHLLIHKGEKPFECEHCQMRFRRRHHLMHHKCGTQGLNASGHISRSQVTSPSLASDDLDEDIDIDIDVEIEEPETTTGSTLIGRKAREATVRSAHRQLPSPVVNAAIPIPLNLSGIPMVDLPEQTEPEDLSMSTGMHRPHSHSNSSGDSPMSRSPSSDAIHEEDEEDTDMGERSTTTPASTTSRIFPATSGERKKETMRERNSCI